MASRLVVSLDVDWAPDCVIEYVANLLLKEGVRATWFVTHDSPAVRSLIESKEFEIGIHPNFFGTSTQGSSYSEIMKNLMSIVPEATVARTHGMYYSYLVSTYFTAFNIKIDSSYYLRGMTYAEPYKTYHSGVELVHLPYTWTEDGEMYSLMNESLKLSEKYVRAEGIKVLAFHPIHVALNSTSMRAYTELKIEQKDLTKLSWKTIQEFRNTVNSGTEDILKFLMAYKTETISQVVNGWNKQN